MPACRAGSTTREPSTALTAGNLIATVAGAPTAPTLLFVAHMDTVETGAEPIAPRLG